MSNKLTNLFAAIMLTFMLLLAFFSMKGDSATMDELAHLPAGYSYITQKDMRLNPEHPPLIKDLSGLSVWLWSKISGQPIKFPYYLKSWQEDINGQWDFGSNFLYRAGNDADKIIFAGRIPILLILLLLGIYIFKWAKELFGEQTALLSLFLYSFSPTFIAHGRLVTTDVAAAAAIFIALYYFVKWLKESNKKNLIIAGIVFGLAQLTKFSVFLLMPLFGFLVVIWIILQLLERRGKVPLQNPRVASEHGPSPSFVNKTGAGERATRGSKNFSLGNFYVSERHFPSLLFIWKYIIGLILICLIGLLVIYPVYLYHVWNYPVEKQINDMRFILYSYGGGPDQSPLQSCQQLSKINRCPAEITLWMANKPAFRPLAQYLYGLLMVVQRAAGGNTTYFLGEVSAAGWKSYFPIIYAIKEPLAMHILTLIALFFAAHSFPKPFWKNPLKRLFSWTGNHIAEFSMLSFIALYWLTSIRSPLNIGVRHILPTFPFIYILISDQITKWLKIKKPEEKLSFWQKIKFFWQTFLKSIFKYGLVSLIILWQFISVLMIYPHYLAFFNELVGKAKNGYIYVTDSNLDWGQDLKRLTDWVNQQKIKEIYLDYFGGGVAEYYLKDKFRPWWGERDPKELPKGSYLAVSATLLQGGRGEPVVGFTQPHGYYLWLNQYQPITFIGHSIFVFYIP